MKPTVRLRSFLAIASSSLLAMSSANALTQIWDADSGTSGAQDGGGNWTAGGTTFWNGSTNVATTNNITTDIAQFGNGGTLASQATVNVSTQSITGLIFGATATSGYNLTASSAGQILTLGASGITVNSGAQATNVGSANLGITLGANQTWTNSSSSLLTVNSNINLNGQTLTIGNNQNISGNITGAGTITVSGSTARRILSGTNSFTSNLLISSAGSSNVGILAVTSILDSTADSSLGKNNTITLGNGSASAGRLEYIGTDTSSSNRTFIMGGTGNASAQIHNNGTGVLTFTAATLVSPSTGARNFILGGSNNGDNEIQGGINNTGTGVVSLSKTGTGTWILSGANSYTGTTSVSGGKLVLSGANSFTGTSVSGVGELVLSGNNSAVTGTTGISGGGKLVLDYGTQNNSKIGNNTLTLTGGNLVLKGGSHAQAVTTINFYGNAYSSISREVGSTATLANTGVIQANGAGQTSSTLSISAGGIVGTTTANVSGILAAGKISIGSDFAENVSNVIQVYSGYTTIAAGGAGDIAVTNRLTGGGAAAGNMSSHALKIVNDAGSNVLTLDTGRDLILSNGGTLLYAGTAGQSYTINGSATSEVRTANDSGALHINIVAGTLTVNAAINTLSSLLAKTGTGTLVVGGASPTTATTIIQQGVLRLANAAGLGTTALGTSVQFGSALELSQTTGGSPVDITVGAEALALNGTGISDGGALRNHSGSNTYGGLITIGANGARINSNASSSLALTGGITTAANQNVTFGGAGNTTVSTTAITGAGNLIKDGAGTLTLSSGVTHGYTGTTTVTGSGSKLIVNGNISTSVLTTVQTTATLGGTGTVGALTIDLGGFHTPGTSPGIQSTGNYSLAGSLGIEIDGATVGTGYDQVNTTGTVSLSGLLSVTMGYTPAANALFFILANDGSDPITGTFSNATTNGGTYTFGGQVFQISYFADQTSPGVGTFTGGNDIALMAIPEPRTAFLGAIGLIALLRRRRS